VCLVGVAVAAVRLLSLGVVHHCAVRLSNETPIQ
jgi:hypothetical protein